MTNERKRLIRKCDDLVREIVYIRDDRTCQKCKSKSKQLNPAHFIGRTNKAVRWDEGNIVTLCVGCHFYFGTEIVEFVDWFKKRIGEPAFEILKLRSHNKLSTTVANLTLVRLMLEQELEKIKEVKKIMAAGARRGGNPRTESERRARHKKLHPGTKVPKRGTGLGRKK